MLSKLSRVRLRTFHRWAGAILGVQLFLWVITGVYFAWIPIEDIRGDSNKKTPEVILVTVDELIAPKDLILPEGSQIKSLRLETSPKNTVYRLELASGETLVANALSGEPQPPLSLEDAHQIGLNQVKTRAEVIKTQVITEKGGEYKGPVPALRIDMDDFLLTRLYVDPWTGKLILQRNSFWRIYDFLWMLHIMDYSDRENFNNPWIKGFSLGGLVIIASGYGLLLFGRMTRRKTKES